MPLEGKQLQNVAKTVQQVVNEDQEIREIEEMIRKASEMGAPDGVKEGLGDFLKSKIKKAAGDFKKDMGDMNKTCLLYTSPSPRDGLLSRMPSSA